jgi:hypothetical protein
MSFPIKCFSPTEVVQEIKNINHYKAPGYYLVTGKILKPLPRKAVVLPTTIL